MHAAALILAATLLGQEAAAGAPAAPLRVCMVSGSWEYESERSLAAFKQHLEARYRAEAVLVAAKSENEIAGLEALDACDVALFFTRRLKVAGDPLERVRRYALSGKPIVGVRTASHGFQNWLEFDKLVLGGNYRGHFGKGPTTAVRIEDAAAGHPILDGVVPFRSRASLYRTSPLAADCALLLTGVTPDGSEPLAWTREVNGGRVFYTSLGDQDDFENETFRRMIAQALFWAAGREAAAREPPRPAARTPAAGKIPLRLRRRVESAPGKGDWKEVLGEEALPAAETAVIVCDMWDKHWCRGATERAGALAKAMNPVLAALRKRGAQVIHCPSETLYFYAGTPQRRRVAEAPAVPLPPAAEVAFEEPPLPIDDSDGGCDTGEKPWHMAWTRQHPAIEIAPEDGISDDGKEVYRFLKQLGIRNVIYMGVHTNMCVLGRSFGIRQMSRWGFRCVLARDLTDTMYDPMDYPHVPHDEGTELVVRHIEKYWGPSILGADILEDLNP